ncbi:polysaccharide biosynthesis protein [Demequina sp. TTPB684]|uniref:lipopolysaccharide biosynthesis protein n=1 Tax=unclassified Demequina TaxID=2620311 RepID=UPI001CF4EB80|nr:MULTISPECIES: oligosaccharide flippase family protein [unclassified Demequina]MCB2413622.1 polysaccharide biosynthesis protein [Demequina sp. TTPB684]UPU88255.1 polysaccharide biosynthesis protein [Demequina sp. TMPB413]
MSDPVLPPAVPPERVLASGRRALAKRILAFAGAPFLSLVAPFFFLPVLSRLAGEEAWVAIAVGQSVGGFAALIVGMGYPTLAPPVLAVASDEWRRRYIANSLHVRLPVWAVAAVAAGMVAGWLAPGAFRADAFATAIAISFAGLAPTWYWVGVGRALPILWSEVIPRAAAMVVAAGVLLLGGDLLWYPALMALAMAAGPAVVYARVAAAELWKPNRYEVAAVLRGHLPATIAESAAGAYNALAVTLVTAATTTSEAARYVSGDKAYRIGQYGVSSLGNALQGWVAERGAEGVARRMRAAVGLHVALGASGMVGFSLIGPWLTRFLFGADVAITRATAIGLGVAILGISLGTVFGRIGLIMLGARRTFMVCVVSASVVGATALLVAAARWGAPGAAWALGGTEIASGIAQATVLAVLWRRRVRAGQPLLHQATSTA